MSSNETRANLWFNVLLTAVTATCLLGKNYAVFMANHGALIVGKDIEEAMYFTRRLERECEIYYRSLQMETETTDVPRSTTCLHWRDLSYGEDHEVGDESKTSTSD